eukprot:5431277-Prymnesium_polylepis.1
MCSIGRAFLHDHPFASYQPTTVEWHEMVATYLGAPSPLAKRLGVWGARCATVAGSAAAVSPST